MANRIPFVAYFKVVLEQTDGKRFEIWRSRQKMASLIYADLMANFEDTFGNLTLPGGSATWSAGVDALSTLYDSVAYKPQFGDSPDILTVVGFFNNDAVVPYKNTKPVIAGNEVWLGPATGAPGYAPFADPTTANDTVCNALRTAFDDSITSVIVELIRLEVNGVAYGREARHFPRRAGSE